MTADTELACQWCGMADQLELIDLNINVANPQVEFEHNIHRCGACAKLTAEARWGKQLFRYKALEYPRTFRAPIYVLVYPIACGWCGRADMVEPEEINATVGNPASQRHRYDIYACHACDRYTAVSYLGQVFTYPATQDDRYASMYYLEIGRNRSPGGRRQEAALATAHCPLLTASCLLLTVGEIDAPKGLCYNTQGLNSPQNAEKAHFFWLAPGACRSIL